MDNNPVHVSSRPAALTPAEARQVDQTCDRFEAAWKAGPRPDPEEYLNAAREPVRSALLRQLLLLDWDYRCRAGDDPRAGDYSPRFPGDTALIEDIGRAMVESADSTFVWEGGPYARITPWAGDRAPGPGGEAVVAAATGADRYELLREVGRGGIGVVFRGRDRHLGRELAVKVLREDYQDKPDAWQRFFEEARVGSQLQHPAIVPVYEQGWFVDRRPYFTMKLVEGHTLAELLDERADSGQDLPRWLGIFEQVCQAMAYAHARGVVHRDLKPANVMVGAFGEVQVMDWGFAKVLAGDWRGGEAREHGGTAAEESGDTGTLHSSTPPISARTAVTQSGMMMGTPAYMPPEQARGEATRIDARADVFALGAILCEILTGQPPYASGTTEEVCRQAAAGALRGAHARLDACGADEALRRLAKRCLVAERAARPVDAGVVAREVTAYLASAQERLRQAQVERAAAEARAQEAGAKARAERHARRLTLALAAALLLGTAVAAWQAVVATTAKRAALTAAEALREAKETADAKEAETQAVLAFVQERIFAAARPKGQAGGLGRDVTLREALEAALPVVEKSFAAQPLIEARLRLTLGESFLYLGVAPIAADQFHKARTLYTEHRGPGHPDTLSSMHNLANSYAALGRHPDALKLHEEALALRQAKLGPDHPDTLTNMNNLAVTYTALGRYPDALKLHEEALALRQAKLGPDHPDTLTSMNNLARSYIDFARHADAIKLGEEALALRQAKLGPDHLDTLESMNTLTIAYAALGRHADAVKFNEAALPLRQAKQGPDHPATLRTMNNLANGYSDLGRHADALKLREETLALQKAKLPLNHPDTFMSMHNLANSYRDLGRHADALKLREETLALREATLSPTHPETLRSMRAVAESLVQLDRGAEAVPLIDECLRRAAGQVVHPRLIPGVMDLRLRHFAKAKDAAGCRGTAEMWEKLNRTDAASLYRAAGMRAVTAAVLAATDQSEANAEADRAMAWLKKAVAAGYKDGANMTKDTNLDALRDRADFRALLAELKAED